MDEQNQEDLQNKPLPQPTRRQRFTAWRKRYVRPIWCVRMAVAAVASVVDIEDVIYVSGILMLSFGAEIVYGHGHGLLVAGAVVLTPSMTSLMFSRKGPQK